MGLTKFALTRPLTMLMVIILMIILGVQGFNRLQLDRFPAVDFPFVTITTIFPGASPEDVEDLVVKPIEDAVATISGIDALNSISTEGAGTVILAFVEGVDGNQAAIDVERQLGTVRGQLPDEAEDPIVIKADFNAIPVLIMTVSGPQSQDVLFDIAEDDVKPRLQSIDGVASVSITGGRERQVQIQVDPAKLAAFKVNLRQIQDKLSENNITFPAGSIEEGRQKISVRSVGEFADLTEIRSLVIKEADKDGPGSGQVFLSDVAAVEMGLDDVNSMIRYNGQEAVSISAVKSSDANTVDVVNNIYKSIDEINEALPPGAELTVVLDNASFIKEAVSAVLEDLVLAVLITGLVILFFLHSIRSTLIVVIAIPTSIISTFLVMWMLGFSLNQLTLLALTLVIGILVDDSIVVIENVNRHIDMKKPPMQAAQEGRAEIGLAAITISLVDVVVYIPVAFTSGIVGQFFYSYGVTVAVAALISLFVAFTLTPMLAGLWLPDKSKSKTKPSGTVKIFSTIFRPITWLWEKFIIVFEGAFQLLASLYAYTLRFFLWNFVTQFLAVLIAVVALAGGFYLVVGGFVGTEFLPQEDDGQVRISIELPAGTNLNATDQAVTQIENIIINEVPETSGVLAQVGTGGGGGPVGGGSRASNRATVNLTLVDKENRTRSTIDVVDDLRPLLQKVPEATVSVTLNSGAGGGGDSPIQFQLYGNDAQTLIDLANQVEAVILTVPGTADVKNTDAARSPETQFIVDRQLALDLGLSPAQVATTLRTSLSGSNIGKFTPADSNEIDINLRMNEATRQDVTTLLDIPIKYTNGQPITLDRVADIDTDLAPARITRSDRRRVLTVGSGVSAEASTGDLTDALELAIEEQVDFPPGYGFRVVGMSEVQRESFAQLGQSILLAIVLVYMLLVALFQSWLQPLAIMFSLPVALVGAFAGLYVTGNTLNLFALLGIIVLVGVVTKNAIILVDFTNNLRTNEGYERKKALIVSGRLRLRAILMTTLTLFFALLPLVLGAGAGSENRGPLAAVVIGGITSSTLLTLILVPVVYNFFDWISELFAGIFRAIFGGRPIDDAPPPKEPTDNGPPPSGSKPSDDKESKPTAIPPTAAPQAGSAISLNPPEPDTV